MDGLLLQKPEKEAAGQKKTENFIRIDRIAPYVRYVNYKIFEGGTLLPERIIYDHECPDPYGNAYENRRSPFP